MGDLDILYERLKQVLKNEGKLVEDSVILSFINVKSNARLSYLAESSVASYDFNGPIEELLSEGLIQTINNKYCLTAKAIWDFESGDLLENDKLVMTFQKKYFACPVETDITIIDKEKVILLTLVLARAFSHSSAMNLKLGEKMLRLWEEIIFDAYDILNDLHCITLEKDKLFGKPKNEDKVSDLIRHTDSLPKKTGLMYEAIGEQRYCLKVIDDDGSVSKEKLTRILRIIFDRPVHLSITDTDRICDLCIDVANEKAFMCFADENEYISHKNDEIIEQCLLDIY